MSRIETAPKPAAGDATPGERSLWPIVLIVAGVAASIFWVMLIGWWVASAVAAMI